MYTPLTVTHTLDMHETFVATYRLLEETRKNVFITGKAGTGKSTLLQYFRAHTCKNVVVVAPTGVAALTVGGQTIHSFFRFKPDSTLETVAAIRLRRPQREMYERIDILVIDEISMVRADLLDCIDVFLRKYGPYKDLPFGGVQMVFFGDLYQLPPVVTRNDAVLFSEVYKSPYFFDAHAYPALRMTISELPKVYRQTHDQFIEILNAIRNNTVTDEHLRVLNRRVIPQFHPAADECFLYLTATNAMADEINARHLAKLTAKAYEFVARTDGTFERKIYPAPDTLPLKIGAQVMLLNNDPAGRWVNGSLGRIVSIGKGNDSAEAVGVCLSDGSVVEVKPMTWEMFRFFFNEEAQMIDSEVVGAFTQYPLRLAWAVTIHKSQGQTFSRLVIDVGRGTFAPGQMYVALSRCTALEGIVLTRPIVRRHIMVDDRIVAFLESCQYPATDGQSIR